MNWDKIKNFVIGGAAAAIFVAFMGFVDWRIGVKVDEALAAQDAADALAAAICHANAGRIGALTQGNRLPAKRTALRVRRAP